MSTLCLLVSLLERYQCFPREDQGPSGRCFQLRDGSGSGIGKNFGFGFGYGSGSGISTAFLSIGYYRVLKILIGYFPDKVLSFGSTKVLAALEPLDPSTRLARIYILALIKFWDAVLVEQKRTYQTNQRGRSKIRLDI